MTDRNAREAPLNAGRASRAGRHLLLGILAVALLLRLLAALVLPPGYRFEGDAVEYVSVARHVLEQGIFGEESGVPYATIPPGYPLFVAGLFVIGKGSLLAVRLAQVFLAVGMVLLLHVIGSRVASGAVGMLAAGLLAVYPPWILWPSLYLTETLFTFVLLTAVLGSLYLLDSPTPAWSLVTGALFGLVTLIRELMAPFFLVVPVLLALRRVRFRTILMATMLMSLALVVTLSPWLYRNARTFGTPFLSERLEAVRYRLTGSGYLAPRYRYLADPGRPEPARKPEAFRRRFGETPTVLLSPRLAVDHPVRYLGFLWHRIQRLWLHPVGLVSVPGGLPGRVGYVGVHLVILVLAVLGFTRGLRQDPARWGAVLAVVLYGTAVILLVAWPHPRYTLPFVPLVLLAAANGAVAVWHRTRASENLGG